jgi:hypothetical protein
MSAADIETTPVGNLAAELFTGQAQLEPTLEFLWRCRTPFPATSTTSSRTTMPSSSGSSSTSRPAAAIGGCSSTGCPSSSPCTPSPRSACCTRRWLRPGETDESDEGRDEHTEAAELLVTLGNTEPGEPEFEDALTKLITAVRHHVVEEETEFLPRFRQAVGPERMAELGLEFLAAKRAAPTYAHPNAPSSETGHKLLDAGAKLVDKVRDLASGRVNHLATGPSGILDPQASGFSTPSPRSSPCRSRPSRLIRPAANRRYTPINADDALLPVVLWIHGGGWVLPGSPGAETIRHRGCPTLGRPGSDSRNAPS